MWRYARTVTCTNTVEIKNGPFQMMFCYCCMWLRADLFFSCNWGCAMLNELTLLHKVRPTLKNMEIGPFLYLSGTCPGPFPTFLGPFPWPFFHAFPCQNRELEVNLGSSSIKCPIFVLVLRHWKWKRCFEKVPRKGTFSNRTFSGTRQGGDRWCLVRARARTNAILGTSAAFVLLAGVKFLPRHLT